MLVGGYSSTCAIRIAEPSVVRDLAALDVPVPDRVVLLVLVSGVTVLVVVWGLGVLVPVLGSIGLLVE